LVRSQKEGYISYVWHFQDDLERLEPKESYIRLFEPWGWIIGTGIYVQDVEAEIANLRKTLVRISLVVVCMVFLLLTYLVRNALNIEKSRHKAEKLLKESMERYRFLTESATEGALFVFHRRLRFSNSVMSKMLGCELTQLEWMDLDDIFPDLEGNAALRTYLDHPSLEDGRKTIIGILQRVDGTRLKCTITLRREKSFLEDGWMILVRREMDGEPIEKFGSTQNKWIQLPKRIAHDLTDQIGHATNPTHVVELCRKIPELAASLLFNVSSAVEITQMISTITDAATKRLIALAMDEIGPPEMPFVFLAMGSQGRESQTMYSDQDNAILYQLEEGADEAKRRNTFTTWPQKCVLGLNWQVIGNVLLATWRKMKNGASP
jgi:PAS domain-containing protein